MNWYKIETEHSPGARVAHSMAYNEKTGKVIMFGGHSAHEPRNDTWTYDGTDWTLIPQSPASPSHRFGPEMTFDSDLNRVLMFGGGGEYYGQETYEYFNTAPDVCEQLGVTIEMPDDYFRADDEFYCRAKIYNNTGMRLEGMPLFIMLDAFGSLFWGPDFGEDVDCYIDEYPVIEEGETTVEAVEPFEWPDNAGEAQGICFYAAMTDPDVSFLYGFMDSAAFGWGE